MRGHVIHIACNENTKIQTSTCWINYIQVYLKLRHLCVNNAFLWNITKQATPQRATCNTRNRWRVMTGGLSVTHHPSVDMGGRNNILRCRGHRIQVSTYCRFHLQSPPLSDGVGLGLLTKQFKSQQWVLIGCLLCCLQSYMHSSVCGQCTLGATQDYYSNRTFTSHFGSG